MRMLRWRQCNPAFYSTSFNLVISVMGFKECKSWLREQNRDWLLKMWECLACSTWTTIYTHSECKSQNNARQGKYTQFHDVSWFRRSRLRCNVVTMPIRWVVRTLSVVDKRLFSPSLILIAIYTGCYYICSKVQWIMQRPDDNYNRRNSEAYNNRVHSDGDSHWSQFKIWLRRINIAWERYFTSISKHFVVIYDIVN